MVGANPGRYMMTYATVDVLKLNPTITGFLVKFNHSLLDSLYKIGFKITCGHRSFSVQIIAMTTQ